jgi:hypothetical protein
MRYAIIDLATRAVSNIAEISFDDGSTEPAGFLNVQSDIAAIGDSWDGISIIPQPQPLSQIVKE